MREVVIILTVLSASVTFSQDFPTIASGPVSVSPLIADHTVVGFRVDVTEEQGKQSIPLTFGSLGNITASKVEVRNGEGWQALRFGPLVANPTPTLAPASQVTVTLYEGDRYPEVSFHLALQGFNQAAWETRFGKVPFHFLVYSLEGAEIFHQRGWSIATPVEDQYIQMQAEGPGRTIVSEWSRNWVYAPPIGAYPVPVCGLWNPSGRRYVGYDFHEARLTDNSEKLIGSSYCWELEEAKQFMALVWPYAEGYNRLRYPEGQESFGTRFRLMYSFQMGPDEDPNRLLMEHAWQVYKDLLPDAPTVADVSWYPAQLRINGFGEPALGRLYQVAGEDARWEEPGAITAYGVGYGISPIDAAYRRQDEAALAQLLEDINFLLPYAVKQTIEGDECVFWVKPIVGEMARMFGPGVETIHNVQAWGVAQALLDTYRNDPTQVRLLPYIDGALRYTKHILYTRNCYPDVPAAQFAWSAAPVAHFCLTYYYTFRESPERAELAKLAWKLARNMTYRYLAIWTSDNDQMDDLDAAYLMEPNAGLPWLGAACANEIWVVCHALAEVYVATGDPILGQYLLGMLERWPLLAMDEYYPRIEAQGDRWAERYGLFEGAQQAKGTRASFGGIWGGFEQLSWPVGNADVRVLCGEASALTFNRGGIHTTIGDFAATGEGDFSFRLLAAGVPQRGDHELTVVVTAPFFDISEKPLSRERAGERTLLQRDHDYRTFPHRRDTVTIRGLHHNDTVIIGSAPPGPGITPQLVKPRRLSPAPTTKMGHFTLLNLAPIADMEVPTDWSDPQSLAGLPRGRRVVYGIPFELVDPDLNHGKAAVEKAEIVLDQGGKTLLLLARAEDDEQGLIRVTLADGTERTVSAKGVPVLNGWPPLFEWTLDLVRVPLGGLRAKVKAENAAIFAVTVASEKADLRPTQTALQVKQQEAEARRRTIAGLRELAQLFDHFTGHLAVLPVARTESARSSPLVKMFRQAGAYDALTFLTAEQLVDPNYFNAERFWVALYLGSEVYQNSVREQGDVIASLQRYLREGGTLVVLPSGPFPFYYDETGKVTIRAAEVGLPINGSGFEGRRDRLPAAERLNITGWERPPEGKQFTFHLRPDQSIITSLPKQFPFPKTGDLRWRPVANIIDDLGTYTPLLTLYDQTGSSYGEGAAMIEYHQGPLAGGRVVYVWTTLVHSQEYQAPLVTDLMRHLLNNIVPPPARALCYRASSPIVIDGKLDEPAWQNVTPLDKFGCFLTKRGHPTYPTRAKVLWDDENLYVGFEAEDPDIWSEHTQRDGPLWEGEVCEVYVDPDSDGREYLEFEVNPLNTVIDLKIPREEDGTPLQVSVATKWNAEGWRTAVAVEGEVQNRTDRDRSWSVEMAIPLTNFAPLGGPPPKVGDTWRLQLYRIDRSNTLKEPEFSSWSPTDTFHRPSQFGRLTFAGPPNTDDFSLYSPGSSGAPFWRLTAGTWEVVEGVFRGRDCLISGWLPSGAVMEQTVVENFVLRLRFQIVSRGSDWRDGPWIGFRYNGPESAYSLNFGSQDVSLHKAYGGLSTNDDANLGSVSWHPDDSWHTVEIVMNGAEIAVRLDDSPLLAARDANTLGVGLVPPGNICLAARRWGNSVGHTEILFDDIAIEKHD